MNNETVRPTKKQRELLAYIEQFIIDHGYSPSYREVMNGLNYTSVATVSLHINSLIRRGHLRKRDRSARSLEVVSPTLASGTTTAGADPAPEHWLLNQVEEHFRRAEEAVEITVDTLESLATLLGGLRVLGLERVVADYEPRLDGLRNRAE